MNGAVSDAVIPWPLLHVIIVDMMLSRLLNECVRSDGNQLDLALAWLLHQKRLEEAVGDV